MKRAPIQYNIDIMLTGHLAGVRLHFRCLLLAAAFTSGLGQRNGNILWKIQHLKSQMEPPMAEP
jgi:hypothetical protein